MAQLEGDEPLRFNRDELRYHIDFEKGSVSYDKQGKFSLNELISKFEETMKKIKVLEDEYNKIKKSKQNCLKQLAIQSPKLQNGGFSRNSSFSEKQIQFQQQSPLTKAISSEYSTQLPIQIQRSYSYLTQGSIKDVLEPCRFCQIDAAEIVLLSCQHTFHQSCLMKLSIEFLHSDNTKFLCPSCGAPIMLELFDSLDETKVHTQELKYHQIYNQLKQIWKNNNEILKCETEECMFYFLLSKDDKKLESYCPLCINYTKGVRP